MTDDVEAVARPELLRCPFCGGAAQLSDMDTPMHEIWKRVECASCLAKSSGGRYPAIAIAAWNTRAAIAADPIEALEAIVEISDGGLIVECDAAGADAVRKARTALSRSRGTKP